MQAPHTCRWGRARCWRPPPAYVTKLGWTTTNSTGPGGSPGNASSCAFFISVILSVTPFRPKPRTSLQQAAAELLRPSPQLTAHSPQPTAGGHPIQRSATRTACHGTHCIECCVITHLPPTWTMVQPFLKPMIRASGPITWPRQPGPVSMETGPQKTWIVHKREWRAAGTSWAAGGPDAGGTLSTTASNGQEHGHEQSEKAASCCACPPPCAANGRL
jgi:hypothetical protein